MEAREYNVILHRVKESKDKTPKDQIIHDQTYVDELCCSVLDVDVNTKEITCLGKPENGRDRPLRITCNTKEEAMSIHDAARKLKNTTEDLKELVAEAKAKNLANQASPWDYKVRSRGPHWKPRIVSLRKRMDATAAQMETQTLSTTSITQHQTTPEPESIPPLEGEEEEGWISPPELMERKTTSTAKP
jgi:hypothetical protein